MCLNESLLKEIAAAIAEQNALDSMTSGATVDEQRSDTQDLPQTEAGIVVCLTEKPQALCIFAPDGTWVRGFLSVDHANTYLSHPHNTGDLLMYSALTPKVLSIRFVLERCEFRGYRGIALTPYPHDPQYPLPFTYIEVPR